MGALGRPLDAIKASFRLAYGAARGELLLLVAAQVVAAVAVVVQLLAVRQLVAAIPSPGTAGVAGPLVLLVAATGTGMLAAAVQVELQLVVGEVVMRQVQSTLALAAALAPLESFDNPAFFDHLERAQAGAEFRPFQLVVGTLAIAGTGLAILAVALTLAAIQPLLLMLVLVAGVPLWIAASMASGDYHRFAVSGATSERSRRYLFGLLTSRTRAAEVRAFGLESFFSGRMEELQQRRVQGLRRIARRRLLLLGGAALVAAALSGVVLVVLGGMVRGGAMSVAAASAALVAVMLLVQRLRDASQSVRTLFEGALFLDDYRAFVTAAPLVEVPGAAAPLPLEELRLSGVSFVYRGGQRAVDGVDLVVQRGEIVAVVGENGAGKSTLARLICGLYQPAGGRVTWDGVDVAEMPAPGVRRSVAAVFQDYARYLLSARENIAVGNIAALGDDDGLRGAARAARIDEVIAALPDGYETVLGAELEGGVDLSLGQWQRVAVARALFRDAPLLVMDEPAAALDPDAERDLLAHVRRIARERATVVISHRLASVRDADRVYVMRAGRVVECGTHDELMARGGEYNRLFREQAGGPQPLAAAR